MMFKPLRKQSPILNFQSKQIGTEVKQAFDAVINAVQFEAVR
jgi:hypothetical protein